MWCSHRVNDRRGDRYARVRIRTNISVDVDGTLHVDGHDEDAPTDEERAAIAEAFKDQKPFPTQVRPTASQAAQQREKRGVSDEHWFIFPEARVRDRIIMCQERIEDDKGKRYLPWSYWLAPGKTFWKMMEPIVERGGRLPLWKPPENRNKVRLMIHEGAKAARFCDELVNNTSAEWIELRKTHPWFEYLRNYEHWGWIGGAPNPLRTDWAEVRDFVNMKTEAVVLVCDNDADGMRAAQTIKQELKGYDFSIIRFDDRFGQGFDLADQLPERWFKDASGRRTYTGPPLEMFVTPAIWATRELPREKNEKGEEKKGPPSYVLRDAFTKDWYWAHEPGVFIHRRMRRVLRKEDVFNVLVRPFSDVEDTARLMHKRVDVVAAGVCYRPGEDAFTITDDQGGGLLINTWMPTTIQAKKGDATPWFGFVGHLFPDEEDRREALRYCATLVGRPDIRMLYGMLLVGDQRVGKGTWQRILLELVGRHNCSQPSESDLFDSPYNYFLIRKRLVIIHEIYQGHSWRAYDKLKDRMTESPFQAHEKFLAPYWIENWTNWVAASNDPLALRIPNDDRRWLIPQVTDKQKDEAYWKTFHTWLDGDGLGIIHQWAIDHVKKPGVVIEHAAIAPKSKTKDEMIKASMSEGQRLAVNIAMAAQARADETKEPVAFTDRDVLAWVASARKLTPDDKNLEKPLTIRHALINGGLKQLPNSKRIHGIDHYTLGTEGATSETPKTKINDLFEGDDFE
jgi:hypothetical protein